MPPKINLPLADHAHDLGPHQPPRAERKNDEPAAPIGGGRVERTYHFDPSKVIAWLLRNGLVEMERTGERTLSFREPNVAIKPRRQASA